MPPGMTRKLFSRLEALGESFARTGELDPKLLRKIAGVERFGFFGRLMIRALLFPMIHRFFWNRQLKENNALDRVHNQPYTGGG